MKTSEGDGYKFLELKAPAVQGQRGVKVFAIAFAYHAAKGDDWSSIRSDCDHIWYSILRRSSLSTHFSRLQTKFLSL